jgi:hypothetical protein
MLSSPLRIPGRSESETGVCRITGLWLSGRYQRLGSFYCVS